MICVSLIDRKPEGLAAARQADLVELRLDHLGADGWEDLAAKLDRPVIVTYRRRDQGGAPRMAEVPEEDRLALLARACRSDQAAYVDVEFGCDLAPFAERKAKLIVSSHDFEGLPDDLPGLCRRMAASGADVVKVAVTVTDAIDQLAVYRALRECAIPAVVLAMREEGLATRVIGLREGAAWSYAAPDGGVAAAPGQIPIGTMRRLYRAGTVNPNTKVYGVIGEPIAHSLSPAIHNAAFAAEPSRTAGIDAVYVPFLVHGDPAALVRAFREIPVSGYSVTIPHKSAVMAALDWIDPLAARIGAVNTIVEKKGKLHGYNTDCLAALSVLAGAVRGGILKGRRVVIVGAGGAARAVACGLVDRGARVVIANRTVSRAEALAAELGCQAAGLDAVRSLDFEILVNTTPVGMHPGVDVSPVPADALKEGTVVFDTIYNPLETRLLQEAASRGCKTIDGLAMFVGQGAAQFELWTGRPAPRDLMREVCLERLAI